jgi:hypothetical protein
MTRVLSILALPLFAKDLTVLANRSATYRNRALYCLCACGFFVAAYVQFQLDQTGGIRQSQYTDFGENVLALLWGVAAAAVFVLLPGSMARAVCDEKRDGTLQLLLLTGMGPTRIVLEKYCSRLFPVLTAQFMLLPLCGILYSFGGLSPEILAFACALITAEAALLGAVSLLFSVLVRSAMLAIVLSYAVGGALLAVEGALLDEMTGSFAGPLSADDLGPYLMNLLLILIMTVILLLAARGQLVQRALAPPSTWWKQLTGAVDDWFADLNERYAGATVLVRDVMLPRDRPMLWLECSRSGHQRFRNRFRVACVLMLPAGLTLYLHGRSGVATALQTYTLWLWGGALLFGVLATVIRLTRERREQTLGVLLSTPLRGRDIVADKVAAVWRDLAGLLFVVLLLLVTANLLYILLGERVFDADDSYWRSTSRVPMAAAAGSILGPVTLFVYGEALFWGITCLTLVLGRGRALFVGLAIVGGLLTATTAVWQQEVTLSYGVTPPFIALGSALMTPAAYVPTVGDWSTTARADNSAALVALAFAVQAVAALGFRWLAYACADRAFGRGLPGVAGGTDQLGCLVALAGVLLVFLGTVLDVGFASLSGLALAAYFSTMTVRRRFWPVQPPLDFASEAGR